MSVTVTDIGNLLFDLDSSAYGINDYGQVVGSSFDYTLTEHAFLWQNGVMTSLGTLPGYSGSEAHGINDSGEIVGSASTSSGSYLAFVIKNGVMTSLGTVSGDNLSIGAAINNAGTAVGIGESSTNGTEDGFVTSGSGLTKLPTLTYGGSYEAFGINNAGDIVGTAITAGNFSAHAILWKNGSPIDLGNSSGTIASFAYAVNASDQVVGFSLTSPASTYNTATATWQAFLWQDGTMSNLPDPSGATSSQATGINDSGQIVGTVTTSSGVHHAVMWQNGSIIDLNSLLSASSGWTLEYATAINNEGQIVGQGVYGGTISAFMLTLPPDITNTSGTQTTLTAPLSSAMVTGGGYDLLAFSGPLTSGAVTMTSNNDGSFTLAAASGSFSDHVSGVSQIQFSDRTITIATSDEANVARLYQAALGRAPDAAGLAGWEAAYANNVASSYKAEGPVVALAEVSGGYNASQSIAAGFTNSAEFQADYGSLDNNAFVTQLYQNVLGRAPDAAGLAGWLNALDSGAQTREMVLVGFAESAENITNTGYSPTHSSGWLFQI